MTRYRSAILAVVCLSATSLACANPTASEASGCEAMLIAMSDQVGGDVDTAGLADWYRKTFPEAKEDTSDPQEARFVFEGCAAQFTKRMSLGHGVHVTLDPPMALPLLLDHTKCTTAEVDEGFEHDGRGPLGYWYTECVRPGLWVQLTLHGKPSVTRGQLEQREMSATKVWIQRRKP